MFRGFGLLVILLIQFTFFSSIQSLGELDEIEFPDTSNPLDFWGLPLKDDQVDDSKRAISISDPSFIPLGEQQRSSGNLMSAYQYIMRNLNKRSSRFLLYPYDFSVVSPEKSHDFKEGAVVTPENEDLANNTEELFSFLTNVSSIDLSRATALYDVSIAILFVEGLGESAGDTYTWKAFEYCSVLYNYIGGKYRSCFRASDYLDYISTTPDHEQVSIVYVDPTSIRDGILFENGKLRFGMLIVADIMAGTEGTIIGLLGSDGVNQITNFVNSGGTIYSSGRGALVVEELGLVNAGTFDRNEVLFSDSSKNANVLGCDIDSFPTDLSDSTWIRRVLCFSPPRDSNNDTFAGLLSAPIVRSTSGLQVISYWDSADSSLGRKSTSTGASLPFDTSGSYPFILAKQQSKGHVIVHLGTVTESSRFYPWFYNSLFLSMSRPLMLNHNIGGFEFIPALEQVAVPVNLDLKNTFNEDLTEVTFKIYVANGVKVFQPHPAGCTLIPGPTTVPRSDLNTSFFFDCTPSGGVFSSFHSASFDFSLYIEDVNITQRQFGIVMIYPMVNYTIPSRNGLKVVLDYGPATIDAYMAALIRIDVNPDPIGHYPVMGRGQYIDNVVWAENKEETVAEDVSFVQIVPLISPIFDGSDQSKVGYTLEYDWMYYLQTWNGVRDYKYPFTSTDPRDEDTLDVRLLAERNAFLAANWDCPVKNFKMERNSSIFPVLPEHSPREVPNIGYGTNIDNDNIVLIEKFFSDADIFYEHATQRLNAFLDTTTVDGYKSYNVPETWSTGIPEAWRLNPSQTHMRKDFRFTRNDIYFYKARQEYPLPDGVTAPETMFTIDRYTETDNTPCESTFGGARSKVLVQGYYDYTRISAPEDYPRGMRASEWSNELLKDCSRLNHSINAGDLNELDSKTGGKVKMTHYIIPLKSHPEITSGDDLLYFVPHSTRPNEWYYAPSLTTGVSRFGDYPELKALYSYFGEFTLMPELTRKGGRITFTISGGYDWPLNFDPVSTSSITFGADQVAIYETTYTSPSSFTMKFKRGNMPNEAYGKPSTMTLSLENLENPPPSLTIDMQVEELFYDLSVVNQQERFHRYTRRPQSDAMLILNSTLCISAPALMFNYVLKREKKQDSQEYSSFIQPYEYLEPFVRQGTYMQDIKARETVWNSPEFHPINDVGFVSPSGGFAWINNIGINSIPFREYLNTGVTWSPLCQETGRIMWTDIWGRKFQQPVRSVFVDVPPIPPPVRNFMMTTTFEILTLSGERRLHWQSDEPMMVRAQMKLLNNYPKWFEITNCLDNTVLQNGPFGKSRVFDADDIDHLASRTSTSQFIQSGHNASYGICLSDPEVVLETVSLSQGQRDLIQTAQHCTHTDDWYEACAALIDAQLPTVSRRPSAETDNVGSNWMYIKETEDHWPTNYIKQNMWDMTHYDYDDNWFDKAYKYHMDNNLPSVDIPLTHLHNIIAFPLFKGLGYEMTYKKTATHPRFPNKMGWWSDNLQNRDHTIVAGQQDSNDIAVGQPDLRNELGTIEITDLENYDPSGRLGNIYVCEFNRHRVRVDPQNDKITFPNNVYDNNIVPIDPDLDKNDERLSNYQCDLSKGQYSPDNISQFDNYVFTQTPRDWLYFGANLRGNAKEDINVLYTLNPLDNVNREGITKVQDGGRFVYWNPCCGINAYLIVDDPVSTAIAERVDLEIEGEIFPPVTQTFDSTILHLVKVSDPDEIDREFTMPIYINHFGFGDSAVSVYVGGFRGTDCILLPGEMSYVKVEFFNNAGFDWHLIGKAIESDELDSYPINANDLLFRLKHAIKAPRKYNFMIVDVDPEIRDYITLIPSDHNIDTAPLFFDFENINVLEIRDGFKGQYFYKLSVHDDFPDDLTGRLYEIKVSLNYSCFDMLPGYNDPTPSSFSTSFHDYLIEVPPIVFGVPYPVGSKWQGAVHYTSGYARNIQWGHQIPSVLDPVQAFFVSEHQINQLRNVSSRPENRTLNLNRFWDQIVQENVECEFTHQVDQQNGRTIISFDPTTSKGDLFPFVKPPVEGPDEAETFILLNTYGKQLPPGWLYGSYWSRVIFDDRVGKQKSSIFSTPLVVRVTGAYLSVVMSPSLAEEREKWLSGDEGEVKVNITATNTGTSAAYHVNLVVDLAEDIEVVSTSGYTHHLNPGPNNTNILFIRSDMRLLPGEPFLLPITLKFPPANKNSIFSQQDEDDNGMNDRVVIVGTYGLHSNFDLTETVGEKTVEQDFVGWFNVPMEMEEVSTGLWIFVLSSIAAVVTICALCIVFLIKNPPRFLETEEEYVPLDTEKQDDVQEDEPPKRKPHHQVAAANYIMTGGIGKKVEKGDPSKFERNSNLVAADDDLPEDNQPPPKEQSFSRKVSKFIWTC